VTEARAREKLAKGCCLKRNCMPRESNTHPVESRVYRPNRYTTLRCSLLTASAHCSARFGCFVHAEAASHILTRCNCPPLFVAAQNNRSVVCVYLCVRVRTITSNEITFDLDIWYVRQSYMLISEIMVVSRSASSWDEMLFNEQKSYIGETSHGTCGPADLN